MKIVTAANDFPVDGIPAGVLDYTRDASRHFRTVTVDVVRTINLPPSNTRDGSVFSFRLFVLRDRFVISDPTVNR